MTYAQAIEEILSFENSVEETEKQDAYELSKTQKLTGYTIELPSGHQVVIERSNGFVMTGYDSVLGWWAIDLRNDKASVVALPQWMV